MNYHIYFPNDLLGPLMKTKSDQLILGYKVQNAFVCVSVSPMLNVDQVVQIRQHKSLGDIQVVGSTTDEGFFSVSGVKDKLPRISPLEPHMDSNSTYTVVMYRPPNYRNLEYFSIHPISLQSVGVYENDAVTAKLLPAFEKGYRSEAFYSSIADQEVLDKVNIVSKRQFQVKRVLQRMRVLPRPYSISSTTLSRGTKHIWNFVFTGLSYFVLSIQMLTLYIIKVINFKVCGISLVNISQVFNQLDLRLKQVTYFPIQFLCFYDKNILYKGNEVLLKELGLPQFNSNLNINNSNYINLYNSVWLMVNDVLLGFAAWSILQEHTGTIITFLNDIVLERALFSDLHQLISWISYHHPAGFKLNNELGSFIGDLFLWSLNTWRFVIERVISSRQTQQVGVLFVKGLCHLGLTFFVGFLVDLLRVTTFHVLWFYQTSARVYQKQIAIIKSLFQLFRGKKYNVLRNRVDNLDNYSSPGEFEFFEVDQLLLGTLLFMILILLLPTIFSFYLTFFIIRLFTILVLNFLENVLIIINFVPLFVVLLKLKNSSRLQGGVTFQLKAFDSRCTYLELRNKSLTYPEIFKNFTFLFRHMKNFRTSLIQYFVQGHSISLNHNQELKFHYLMLPENLEKSIDIWKYFTSSL